MNWRIKKEKIFFDSKETLGKRTLSLNGIKIPKTLSNLTLFWMTNILIQFTKDKFNTQGQNQEVPPIPGRKGKNILRITIIVQNYLKKMTLSFPRSFHKIKRKLKIGSLQKKLSSFHHFKRIKCSKTSQSKHKIITITL